MSNKNSLQCVEGSLLSKVKVSSTTHVHLLVTLGGNNNNNIFGGNVEHVANVCRYAGIYIICISKVLGNLKSENDHCS